MDEEHEGSDDRGVLTAPPGYRVTRRLPPSSATLGRALAVRVVDGLEVQLTFLGVAPGAEGEGVARASSVQSGMVVAAQISRIRHEHLVRVHDVIPVIDQRTAQDQVVLATARARGGSLTRHLYAVGRLSLSQATTVVVPIAEALHHLHRAGVVHAAVTSDAVVFAGDSRPLLADVGIPQITGTSPTAQPGRQGWVAPEVVEGYESSVESDVFAFTALVWQLLTGDTPARVGEGSDRDPMVEDLPEPIRDVLHRGMAVDPETRPDLAEIVAAFRAAGAAEPISVKADAWSDVPTTIRAMAARRPVSHRAPTRHPSRAATAMVAMMLLVAVVVWVLVLQDSRTPVGPSAGGPTPTATPTAKATATADDRGDVIATSDDMRDVGEAAAPPERAAQTRRPQSPGEIIDTVLRARATAWQSGDPQRLRRAHAPDSEALAKDTADLRAAVDTGAQFRGVEFGAREIEVTELTPADSQDLETATQFTAHAVVDRGPLRIVTAGRETQRVQPSSDLVRLTLRRGPEGWRLWSWDTVES
ncbi:MAG: protein kinase [Ornithinimicrobium sp.]